MIEEPPLLTVRRRFRRPSKQKLDRLRGVPTSVVVDAQSGRGALDYRVKPLEPESAFIGPAITAWCGPADNLAALAALEFAQAGDVIVIATDGYENTCVLGDRFAGMCANKGVAAIVTDGLVRDRVGIVASGVPCYARGLVPNSPYAKGPGEVGMRVTLCGAAIEAGDIVVGDGEGVVIVPRGSIDGLLRTLEQVQANEARMDGVVRDGATGFGWVAKLLKTPQTCYLD